MSRKNSHLPRYKDLDAPAGLYVWREKRDGFFIVGESGDLVSFLGFWWRENTDGNRDGMMFVSYIYHMQKTLRRRRDRECSE